MSSETEIHPFRVDMPEDAIADLRRRITATRRPSRELVADRSQGVQLATLQELARYWTAEYDWRDLQDPAQLGREVLSEPQLLQRGRQGRSLRRLGRARAVRDRDPGGVQTAALTTPSQRQDRSARCVTKKNRPVWTGLR